MLPILFDFIEENPQRDAKGNLNYVPFGGSAVRVFEEDYKSKTGSWIRDPPRIISDVDLLVLRPGLSYPVHSTNLKDIFSTGLSFSLEEILENCVDISFPDQGKTITIPNRELLIASKSVSVQAVRTKDYEDAFWIHSMGVDENKLADAYEKCSYLPKNGSLVVQLLKGSFQHRKEDADFGYRLFAAIPQRAFILELFDGLDRNSASLSVSKYLKTDSSKDAYQASRVLGGVAIALDYTPKNKRLSVLSNLLPKAKRLHYTEFDGFIQMKVVPSLKYSQSSAEKIASLKSYGLLHKT